jgi:hypothetical protein
MFLGLQFLHVDSSMASWAFMHYKLHEGSNTFPVFQLFIIFFKIASQDKNFFSKNMSIAEES